MSGPRMSSLRSGAVRDLVKILQFRATFGRPTYVKFGPGDTAALIVPSLRDGETGPYEYLRTFTRTTVTRAQVAGLVSVGAEVVDAPAIGGTHWAAQPALKARAITVLPTGQDGGSHRPTLVYFDADSVTVPAEVCGTCSDEATGVWVPVTQCPVSAAQMRDDPEGRDVRVANRAGQDGGDR